MSKKILVVDDEPRVRAVTTGMLKEAGFDTAETGDGLDGLDRLKASRFHLIITDLNMPGMNGIEFLCRAHARFPDIEAVAVSAHGTGAAREKLERFGLFGYLEKPVDREALVEMAGRAVRSNRLDRLMVSQAPPEAKFHHERIIVADDDRRILEIIRRMLSSTGHKITAVENGAVAFESILINDYDLVILDMNMPKMGGLETVRAIRRQDPFSYILLISGEAQDGEVQQALDSGANKFLPKPFNLEELGFIVAQIDFDGIREKKRKSLEETRINRIKRRTLARRVFNSCRFRAIRAGFVKALALIMFGAVFGYLAMMMFDTQSKAPGTDKTVLERIVRLIDEFSRD
jgi:CheY-like chemotaxis protein